MVREVIGRRAYGGQGGFMSRLAAMKDDPAKAERLAAALRENLRKRKAQAREVGGGASAEPALDPLILRKD